MIPDDELRLLATATIGCEPYGHKINTLQNVKGYGDYWLRYEKRGLKFIRAASPQKILELLDRIKELEEQVQFYSQMRHHAAMEQIAIENDRVVSEAVGLRSVAEKKRHYREFLKMLARNRRKNKT